MLPAEEIFRIVFALHLLDPGMGSACALDLARRWAEMARAEIGILVHAAVVKVEVGSNSVRLQISKSGILQALQLEPPRPKLPQLKSSKLLIRLADWKIVAVRYWLHFDGDIEE